MIRLRIDARQPDVIGPGVQMPIAGRPANQPCDVRKKVLQSISRHASSAARLRIASIKARTDGMAARLA